MNEVNPDQLSEEHWSRIATAARQLEGKRANTALGEDELKSAALAQPPSDDAYVLMIKELDSALRKFRDAYSAANSTAAPAEAPSVDQFVDRAEERLAAYGVSAEAHGRMRRAAQRVVVAAILRGEDATEISLLDEQEYCIDPQVQKNTFAWINRTVGRLLVKMVQGGTLSAQSQESAHEQEPLSDPEKDVLAEIPCTDEGGLIGKVILTRLAKRGVNIDQSTLTTSIIPKLKKQYGVKNRNGVGYHRPRPSRQ